MHLDEVTFTDILLGVGSSRVAVNLLRLLG